jgi:uncharacterized protein (DUF1778 family)
MKEWNGLKVETIVLSDEAFDELEKILNAPPKPNPKLVELMRRKKPWDMSNKNYNAENA